MLKIYKGSEQKIFEIYADRIQKWFHIDNLIQKVRKYF